MKNPPLLAAALAALVLASPLGAQSPLSFEVRGSLQKPVGSFADGANSDAGFGADMFVSVGGWTSLYAGYALERFGCPGCDASDGLTSSGFEVGAKFMARPTGSVLPWIRAGATFHTLEVDDGPLSATSDRAVGLQASAGLDIPLGRVLSFSPALRYQTYQAEFDVLADALVAREHVGFMTLDLAVHIHPAR